MSYLSTGHINVSLIKELQQKQLLECIDKCMGTKAIVWDDNLVGSFGLIADYPKLKEHGVTQMFQLRNGKLPSVNADSIVYLVRAKLSLMDIIADNLFHEEKGNKNNKQYYLVFVPRKSTLCERKLQNLGVYGTFAHIDEFASDMFALDSDVISMEWDSAFRECHLENDYTSMFHAAKAIMVIQSLYGVIPNIYGQGKCAKLVYDLMCRMRRELGGDEPQITPQIDCILLIDRSVDLLTPFMTQYTYEGLLDEIYDIKHNTIKLPPEKFIQTDDNSQQTDLPTDSKTFVLNSAEDLFVQLRDKNFNSVGSTLNKSAKNLKAQIDERHSAQTVGEIRQFVAKLPHLQAAKKSQANHTSMAELIKEVTDQESFIETIQTEQYLVNAIETDKSCPYIEDCIARQEPIAKVLRLIAIQSFTNNGLKSKVLDYYKREILQTYGYDHFLTLNNLERVGIFKLYGGYGNRSYNVIRKTLKLTSEGKREENPTDITHIYNNYAPLSVRMAQYLDHPGWRAIPELLKILPEPTVEEIQQIPVGLRKRRNSGASIQSGVVDDHKIILVFFLGGCTFAEISALRFLSQQEDVNADYIVATTKIINGKTFLESLNDGPSLCK